MDFQKGSRIWKSLQFRLRGMENVTSLARSHYGPLVFSQDLSEISFYLPTPWVFGKDLDNFIFGDAEVHNTYSSRLKKI